MERRMACLSGAGVSELRGMAFSRIRTAQFLGKDSCSEVFISHAYSDTIRRQDEIFYLLSERMQEMG